MPLSLKRTTGAFLAVVLGLSMSVAGSGAAQDATPSADQSVRIGDAEITWTGWWEYDDQGAYGVATLPDQHFFFIIDDQDDGEISFVTILSYGTFGDDAAENASEAIEVFADLYLEGSGAISVDEHATGQSDDGVVWSVYTLTPSESDDLEGQSVAALIAVIPNDDGTFTATSLTAATDEIEAAINQVQKDFTIDGEGRFFADIDAAEVTTDLPAARSPGADMEATPQATPELIIATPDATPGG